MNLTHYQALDIISEIEKLKYKPSEREETFMDDIKTKAFYMLTGRQVEFLNNIYERATGGGAFEKKQYFK